MNDEIREILEHLKEEDNYWSGQEHNYAFPDYYSLNREDLHLLLDCITNLQEESKIKDTNWESLKYYLEKLYYKDYIEEAISDDIDKKIKELESKVEIKGYQKDIKALQQENERLKHQLKVQEDLTVKNRMRKHIYKSRCEKTVEYFKYQLENLDFYEDTKARMLCAMGITLLQNGSDNE